MDRNEYIENYFMDLIYMKIFFFRVVRFYEAMN